jgi:uncharacterized protein DUF4382
MRRLGRIFLATSLAASLGACGGGGGSSSPETGPLTLRVTDSPIDPSTIEAVCINFNRITVHYAGQNEVQLEYNPLPSQVSLATHCVSGTAPWNGTPPVPPVRLNALGGPLTVALAESLAIPVGRVTWIRLHFTGGSYVLDDEGGRHDLRCPSCDVTDNNDGRGFKLNRTFEVTSSGIAVTVDIDMLRSLRENAQGYSLRPTARIEFDDTLGTIAGNVDPDLIPAEGLYSGATIETGCAVYVYTGLGITPDDSYDLSPVISTARVRFDTVSGLYRYAAGALRGGTTAAPEPYTVALTCDSDDATLDDPGVMFTAGQNANVVAGQTTPISF